MSSLTTNLSGLDQIVKFDGTNTQLWKLQVGLFFEMHKLMEIVDGKEKFPAGDKTLQNVWNNKDLVARFCLSSTIGPLYPASRLSKCKSSAEMWTKLNDGMFNSMTFTLQREEVSPYAHQMNGLQQIVKLDGKDFEAWKWKMQSFLEMHKLMGVVDGTEKCSEILCFHVNECEHAWKVKDAAARFCLTSTIENSLLNNLIEDLPFRSAQLLWRKLKNKFPSSHNLYY